MILIIDNGMFADTINFYLKKDNIVTTVVKSSDINLSLLEKLNFKAIILSNGNDKKDNISNLLKVMQNYIWKLPILGIGMGAISLGVLFNAKICDTKISNFEVFSINHDKRTIFTNANNVINSNKWCRYAISDELFKKTDLEVSATVNKEIVGFRHKNLAIEGVLFDITSLTCIDGELILKNFIKYYVK